jgi:hypothetical protein
MKHPVEFVPNIPVQLSAHQSLFRRQHIVIPQVAGAGSIEKPDQPFNPLRV